LPTRLVVGQRVRATAEVYTAANDRRDADVVGWTSGAPAAVRVDGDGMITAVAPGRDRKSTRLNSSHLVSSYAVFCLKKKTGSLPAPSRLSRSSWSPKRLSKVSVNAAIPNIAAIDPRWTFLWSTVNGRIKRCACSPPS